MKNLRDWAKYYYNLGFNVTHIVPEKNDPVKKIFKAPTNNRQLITFRRQDRDEMLSYDWDNATGIGMVLERDNIRAIDIDHKSILKYDSNQKLSNLRNIIDDFLISVNLPADYPWVVETPTKGFHIIIQTNDLPYNLSINPNSKYKEKQLKAFLPNRKNQKVYPSFGHFEMRWRYHLTLPPSISKDGNQYNFINGTPNCLPQEIKIEDVLCFVEKYCLEKDIDRKVNGYNLFLDDYHKNHIFLDFNSIYL